MKAACALPVDPFNDRLSRDICNSLSDELGHRLNDINWPPPRLLMCDCS